jgi:putative methyltransferase (TIGR04325 family)
LSTVSQAITVSEHAHHRPAVLRRLRLAQVRLCASFLTSVGRRPAGRRVIVRLRCVPGIRALLKSLLGFRKTFASFKDAQDCAARYIDAGHEHPDELDYHLSVADVIRESDYPVLFHLAPIAHNVRRVLDLGGNVGNLFYAYEKRLDFPADLAWTIYDLPAQITLGEKTAAERGETRLRFIRSLAANQAADVFIASGSLHYFPQPLDQILLSLDSLPTHVFVNRTPCSSSDDLVTVQDNGSYLVPCQLHSRSKLLEGMERLGYRLIAQWPVHELRLWVPLYPEFSPSCYSGFYFRRD